jgi:hypothetical protein
LSPENEGRPPVMVGTVKVATGDSESGRVTT